MVTATPTDLTAELENASQAEKLAILTRWRNDPKWFASEILGINLYRKQVEIIEAMRDIGNGDLISPDTKRPIEQVSVVGANAVGKDFTIGAVGIPYWMTAFAPGVPSSTPVTSCKAVVTGPTARQVAEIVWRETRQSYANARVGLGGRMLPVEPRWEFNEGKNWFALGFSTDKGYNALGFHADKLLVVVSEAHNFGDEHMNNIKRLFPNCLLLSGNPFSTANEFYASHHDKRHLYKTIEISAMDSPNVIHRNEAIPGLVTVRDIQKAADDWGIDSPLFRSSILCEWVTSEDGLIPLHWLTNTRHPARDPGRAIDVGIDVAGPGEDETVVAVRCEAVHLGLQPIRDEDPGDKVINYLRQYEDRLDNINVDAIGIGWGLYLLLRKYYGKKRNKWGRIIRVNAVNVGLPSSRPDRFSNFKAEVYWDFRERIREEMAQGIRDEVALAQIVSFKYYQDVRGRVAIESKPDARKRGVKSPDRGEAIILSYIKPGKRRGRKAA